MFSVGVLGKPDKAKGAFGEQFNLFDGPALDLVCLGGAGDILSDEGQYSGRGLLDGVDLSFDHVFKLGEHVLSINM